MKSVSVQDYRCFRHEQTVKIAPLTLLVGNNSTGKSSLMAMIRCLWEVAYAGAIAPGFDQEPFDLGSFDDIVHYRGGRVPRPASFRSKLIDSAERDDKGHLEIEVVFGRFNDYPAVRSKRFTQDGFGIQFNLQDGNISLITPSEEVYCDLPAWKHPGHRDVNMWGLFENVMAFPEEEDIQHSQELERLDPAQRDSLMATLEVFRKKTFRELDLRIRPRAMAPLRARPQRTYDIGSSFWDMEGEQLPNYLMTLHANNPKQWKLLQGLLADFGRDLGLFDQFEVYPIRRGRGVGPFQLRVRGNPAGKKPLGPWRNLADVGYGVSQVLPLLVALSDPRPSVQLLQQPEIHLHPRAQAALGTLLCRWIVSPAARKVGQQLIIETHSEYLLDRIRMEIRDQEVGISPQDVSVAFFESRGLDVLVHNIEFDREGNVIGTPAAYSDFFMDEVSRSIG